jgi:DNA-binding NtrC family response regulator
MQHPIHVLVVDDDADVRDLLAGVLARANAKVTEAASGSEAVALDILRSARAAEADTEFIVLTGHADVETAVEAMRLGAYDFIAKPWKNSELMERVVKAAEKKALRRENSALKEVITRRDGMLEIVGETAPVREILAMVRRVAAVDSPVLIHGESGTGKELVARAIHHNSRRATRPFVSVNCGALTETLLESELFGHKRGSFSGAIASRVGLFEAAHEGTLFLDEIGEMSPAMQVRLLRALDSGEIRRVGEERSFHVDVRIVAATNKDLRKEATAGRFRWDLYYRVTTVVITVPPLRERAGDIPLLARHFLGQVARAGNAVQFSKDAVDQLMQYPWPGNIRELRNLIERLQILHQGEEVTPADLPAEFSRVRAAPEAVETAAPVLVPLAEVERRHVERVLSATGWNKARAARVLDIDIKTLNKKIRDTGLTAE